MKMLTPEQISKNRNSLSEKFIYDQITPEEYDYICYLEQLVLKLKRDIEQLTKTTT